MEFVSIAVGKALDFVVEPVLRQPGYLLFYKGNVKELIQCAKNLAAARDKVQHRVDDAIRNGEEIETGVENWLKQVNDIITETEDFQKDEGHTKMGCSNGLFPINLRLMHQLGRKAKKMAVNVDGLLLKAMNIDEVSYRLGPTSMDAALSNIGYQSFESRNETMKRIMALLEDLTVRKIGIYGHGGVGKTTLVKEVAKKACDNKLFNVVITVSVTRNPDPKQIQGEIADMLGLRLEEESENGRADRLRQRLKKEKNTLVILDDLWEGLDLNRLGIPFDDEDDFSQMTNEDIPDFEYDMVKKEKPTDEYKGCKILLTSRIKEVLSTQMGVKKNSIFPVGLLQKNEAEELLKKVAGVQGKSLEFEQLSTEIVNECARLPMEIVIIARALTNKDCSEWKDALRQLQRKEFMGVKKPMEFSIKLSYDHLESEELKSFFLICARMGSHALIVDLMKYCIGLAIFQGVHTIREARNRIYTLIRKLKDSSLLLDSDSNDHLNMHDMVRDVALSIASKEKNVFIVRNGKIDEWPDKDELEKCTAISIHNSDIIDELPEGINCPQLKVFHIDCDDPSMRIPDNFFDGMRNLRILILTGIHLPSLPSSIKCLMNLKMLCLEQCKLGGNLSIIGELKKLRILSFSGSEIENLPNELGKLGKLQLFDISNCSKLKGIPPNFISSLNSLEELYMRDSLVQWEIEGQTNQSQNSILDELAHMHQLMTLDICIPNAELLPTNLFFDKLDNYKIVIGDFNMLSVGDFKMPHKYEVSRTLALQLKEATDIHSQKGIKILFKGVENLLLAELNGVQNILNELNLNGFPYLKHLSIVNNFEIKYIINSIEFLCPQSAFPKLESLCLYKLEKLEKICSTKPMNDSFGNLKSIKINVCGQLKNLFSFYMVRLFTKLETIEVSECDSLEEIVVGERDENNENNVEVNNIEFPELRSLTLRSLPKFTGFYTSGKKLSESQSIERQLSNSDCDEITMVDEHRPSASLSLFSEQVAIPNLESLELSSINIHEIWSEQHLAQPFCFQKLIKLNVKDCNSMRYLFTFSMAKSLSNLKSLSVSGCKVMEEIYTCEDSNKDEVKVSIIFPKLEEIQFSSMESLGKIWPSQVSSDSFGCLTSVVIDKCEKLNTVFPGHMIGRFQKLISLKVLDCKALEKIFDLEKISPQTNSGHETCLQFFYIKELPKLEYIWNKDPEGILSFKNLQTVEVCGCDNLKNLLPVSVAKDLDKLQYLEVLSCIGMEEIISSEQGSNSKTSTLFPQVSFLQFQQLPKLKSFYGGRHILDWPELKRLTVCYCDNPEAQPILLDEKVICSLQRLTITITTKNSEWLQRCIGKYGMHNLKGLCLALLPSTEILYRLLRRIPNLENLTLYGCYFNEVFPHRSLTAPEKIGTVVQLKSLVLSDMTDLLNIGFERDPVFQRIERLRLHRCPRLINIVPVSVYFTYLTYLEVSECDALINLMAFSTAKSLVQLTTMKVIKCKMMEEIVRKEGNEEERADEIIFRKLMTLELTSLKKLKSFCSSKNCAVKFPSLEKLIVRECFMMKAFSKGVTSTPKLRQVHIGKEEEEKWHSSGDLNATIRKFFPEMIKEFPFDLQHLELSKHPELEVIWNGVDSVPETCFSNLKSLLVEGCEYLTTIMPSSVLSLLSNLEELEVRNCNSANVIFDVRDIRGDRRMKHMKSDAKYLEKLEKLDVKYCEGLVEIVGKDEAATEGAKKECVLSAVSFSNLKELRLAGCHGLIYLFTSSTAKSLTQLKMIFIEKCESMKEIVAKEVNDTTEDEITFGQLKVLSLNSLSSLAAFYEGNSSLNFPFLIEAIITQCPKMKIFSQGLIRAPMLEVVETSPGSWDMCSEGNLNLTIKKLLLRKIKEFSCEVQHLELSKHPELEVIWNGVDSVPETYFSNLKSLLVEGCEYLSTIIPSSVLSLLSNLEELEVRNCNSAKVIFDARDIRGDRRMKHMKSDAKYLEKLEKLDVKYCEGLVEIVGKDEAATEGAKKECVLSAVSFSNLKELQLAECHRLIYLFTSSTAKSLTQLKMIFIEKCESMKEIVAKEVNDTSEDEITFGQLKVLSLNSLSSLASFYEGNSTLNFPFLVEASITQCPKIKIFSQGLIRAPMLEAVETSPGSWDMCSEGNLNLTIKKLVERKVAKFACDVQLLKLCDHPELIEIFCSVVPVPNRLCFRNLKLLVVEGCEFLSHVIPFNLLTFLNNLKELKVGNCDSVKVIFDLEDIKEEREMIDITPALSHSFLPIKKLTLENLPNLEHVWNIIDREAIFSLPVLQELHVDECKSLKSLFPATMAKGLVKLEELQVQYCEGLEEIVAKNEAATEGATEDFVFPRLMSVILCELPELKNFYPGLHKLKCPMLKELDMYRCYMKFTYESQNFHVIHKLFSWFRKVNLPNLNQLSPKNQTLR